MSLLLLLRVLEDLADRYRYWRIHRQDIRLLDEIQQQHEHSLQVEQDWLRTHGVH